MADYTDVVDTDGVSGDYSSLSLCEANSETDHSAGSGDTLTWQCQATDGDDDTTACTVSGNTVDSITIEGADFPSDGIFDGTKYNLSPSSGNALTIATGEPDIYIDQFQIDHAAGTSGIIVVENATATLTVTRSIIVGNGSSGNTDGNIAGAYNTNVTALIQNCILTGESSGYKCGGVIIHNGTWDIYNCIISDQIGVGIGEFASPTVTIINCSIFNTADDISGTVTATYCAGDDSDFSSGTGNIQWTSGATDWAANFTDYANGDFSIKDTDADIYDSGSDLSATFTDDITGTTRPQWDIGAFAYVAAGGAIPLLVGGCMGSPMGSSCNLMTG